MHEVITVLISIPAAILALIELIEKVYRLISELDRGNKPQE